MAERFGCAFQEFSLKKFGVEAIPSTVNLVKR
jgi:hypothetical protein